MQHYIYDGSGERVLKANSDMEAVYENGELVNTPGTVSINGYTSYPSAFIVITADGVYSKHYYAGTQRIVSRLGDNDASIFESGCVGCKQEPSATPFDDQKLKQAQILDLNLFAEKAKKGKVTLKEYKPISIEEQEKAMAEYANRAFAPPSGAGGLYYYHPDHLGTSTALTDFNGNAYQFFLNLPFGETMAQQLGSNYYNSPFKFNGKELDEETGFYYYGARYYDPKISIWLSVDPLAEKYQNMSPYIYTFNNPINFIDPTGMEGEDPPSSNKLTGSKSLLVYINEPNVKTDLKAMHENSGSYDFVTVDNIDQVQGIMEAHYGKGKEPSIEHLVVRSHGATSKDTPNNHGPDLNNKAGQGVVHDPDNSKGLTYLKGILSNNADIVFTACNSVIGYTDNSGGYQKSSKSLAQNYSEFFLKGTNRNLFFNWAKSSSRVNTSGGQVFNFNEGLHQDSYGGFMQFYYNSSGTWSKNNNFYDITVSSSGGLIRSTIRPLSRTGGGDDPKIKKKKF